MRKRETVVIPRWEGNRDAGKVFVVTEMPAAQAEKWAMRALLLLRNSGERVPDNVEGLGMIGVARIGLNVWLTGTIDAAALEPLMDEMFTCVQLVRDPANPDFATAIVSDDDVEEVQTRLWLRSEVLRVHTGFSPADALSRLMAAAMTPSPAA